MEFEVVVGSGPSGTRHRVTMASADYDRFGQGSHSPSACVEAAFRFLLDREPKEAILRRFDISDIARYFPDFEQKLASYLPGGGPAGGKL